MTTHTHPRSRSSPSSTHPPRVYTKSPSYCNCCSLPVFFTHTHHTHHNQSASIRRSDETQIVHFSWFFFSVYARKDNIQNNRHLACNVVSASGKQINIVKIYYLRNLDCNNVEIINGNAIVVRPISFFATIRVLRLMDL